MTPIAGATGRPGRGRGWVALGALCLLGAALLPACGAAPSATPASSTPASSAPAAKPSSPSASASKSVAPSATKGGSTAAAKPPAYCHAGAAAVGFTVAAAQEPDSSVNRWNGVCWAAIPFSPASRAYWGAVPAADSGRFKVAWSAQGLYVLAWIQAWPLHSHGNAGDLVYFYFEGDNAKTATYGPTACRAATTWVGTGPAGLTCHVNPDHLYEDTVAGKGYYAELDVPWTTLRVSQPAKGQQYAFTVAYAVANTSGALVGGREWAGTGTDIDQETLHWGTITLG